MNRSDQLFSELLYYFTIMHLMLWKINSDLPNDSNLTNVRQLIDMVIMLKEKTQGNLTDELEQIQSLMLTELESKYQQKLKTPETNGSAK